MRFLCTFGNVCRRDHQYSNTDDEVHGLPKGYEYWKQELDVQRRQWEGVERKYEEKLQILTDENHHLKQDQERRVRNAQDAATMMMKGVNSSILSDDEIESFFKKRGLAWYNWS